MSDSALGLTVVGVLVLLVLVTALLDLRRRTARHQVSDSAVRRGLARQEGAHGRTTPQAPRDLGPFD